MDSEIIGRCLHSTRIMTEFITLILLLVNLEMISKLLLIREFTHWSTSSYLWILHSYTLHIYHDMCISVRSAMKLFNSKANKTMKKQATWEVVKVCLNFVASLILCLGLNLKLGWATVWIESEFCSWLNHWLLTYFFLFV